MIVLDMYFQLIEKDLREIEKNVKRDMEKKTSVKELFVKKEYRKAVIILTGNLKN